jgi:ribosomal protein S18/ribosomal protein S6
VSDRVYEIIFVADPDLGEADVDALTEQVQGFVERDGGRVDRVEKWGKKRLAYEVRRRREGYYVLIVAQGGGALVRELERRLKVTDGILRFLTVRVDDDLRKAERRKAIRALAEEKRRARPRFFFRRRKVCKFCADKIDYIDYKDVKLISQFVPERGKVLPRRMFGTCAEHQRKLSVAIKRARHIALLPFAGD